MSDIAPISSTLVELLRKAQHVVALTGAGISAESGLPTFRDPVAGLWNKYDPQTLSTREAFKQNPRLVWEWAETLRKAADAANPNAAHKALVAIEARVPKFTLLTQNVDSLHQRAGSNNVIELHGTLARVKCFDEDTLVATWDDTEHIPPRCPHCGGVLRHDTVLFGEVLPQVALQTAMAETVDCDLFLSIGTSGIVEPAASLPYRAMKHGASVVVVNLDVTTDLRSDTLFKINGSAGQILPALVTAAWPDIKHI
jgi:NAD-dependent deacetylase